MSARVEIASPWRERLQALRIADLEQLLDGSPAEGWPGHWEGLEKPGLGGRARWRWTPDGAAAPIYVKCYRSTGLRMQFDRIRRQTFGHSRAWWEYHLSERLARAHVHAPRVVACVERMAGPFERRSAVLFEQAPGAAFDRYWRAALADGAPITRGAGRRDMVRRLARFVAAFHDTGLCHRDLYLCHVFVDAPADGSHPPQFTLIDLARVHRPTLRRMRWLLKDLAQLDTSARQIGATRADRWRFLLFYLGLQNGAPRARWYARRVVWRSDRILARERRKGRA